jgi:hypothetical protein
MVVLLLKGTSYGFVQTNSLMHHNQIINSSIIINIIINTKNESRGTLEEATEWPWIETTKPSTEKPEIQNQSKHPLLSGDLDTGFWMPAQDRPEPYQKPDFGLLKINDRREVPTAAD